MGAATALPSSATKRVEVQPLAEARLQLLLGDLGTTRRVVPVLPAVAVATDLDVPTHSRLARLLPADDLTQRVAFPVPERVAVRPQLLRSVDRTAWPDASRTSRRADDAEPDRPERSGRPRRGDGHYYQSPGYLVKTNPGRILASRSPQGFLPRQPADRLPTPEVGFRSEGQDNASH